MEHKLNFPCIDQEVHTKKNGMKVFEFNEAKI